MRFRSSGIRRTTWRVLVVLGSAAVTIALPAAAPAADPENEVRQLPAVVTSATQGSERPGGVETRIECAEAKDVAWYRFGVARRGPVVIGVRAAGSLDAVVGVFRERRSAVRELACRVTDKHGVADVAIWGKPRDTVIVGVGRRAPSAAGTFRLSVKQAEPPATPPGVPLPAAGAASAVDTLLDVDDAWSVDLVAGRPARIHLLSQKRNQCVTATLYQPDTVSFEEEYAVGRVSGCDAGNSYLLFTPGPDGGGRYTLQVAASPDVEGPQLYRLLVAAATTDDAAPGIELQNGALVRGSLFGRGVDVVDLYSFSVSKPSMMRAELSTKPGVHFDFALLGRRGSAIGTLRSEQPGRTLRFRELDVGLYYLVVRSEARSGGQYEVSLSVREFTTTHMTIDGVNAVESAPGTPHTLSATVAPAGFGGTMRFQLDRFDPLSGWQFVGFVTTPIDSSGTASTSWTPPSAGSWRIRARFTGTTDASVSQSGPVELFVGPLAGAA